MLAVHRPSSAVSNGDTVQIPMMVASFQKRFPSLSRDTTAARFHTHEVGPNQCCSAVVQEISAPISTVWSVVRRFDNPQAYKHFLKSCSVIGGDGGNVGSLRQVHVVSGLPAASSTERLDILDDERHVISFSVVGGDHRLSNYRSVTTLHPSPISGLRLFREMGSKGLDQSSVTYTVMISGLSKAGKSDEAFGFYDEMKRKGFTIDHKVYTALVGSLHSPET